MRICIISDVHICHEHDEAFKVFKKFIAHPEVQAADHVILLGDILDFMVGNFQGFKKDHAYFFAELKKLKNKKISYFFGNHDFNFEKVFKDTGIELLDGNLIINSGNKKIYISHGDDEEIDNEGYKKYKKIVRSPAINFLVNLIPYPIIKKIGEKASSDSRKRGQQYFDEGNNREKFRKSAQLIAHNGFDVVVFGHSHICEFYEWKENNKSYLYVNNGLPTKDRKFTSVFNGEVKQILLDESK